MFSVTHSLTITGDHDSSYCFQILNVQNPVPEIVSDQSHNIIFKTEHHSNPNMRKIEIEVLEIESIHSLEGGHLVCKLDYAIGTTESAISLIFHRSVLNGAEEFTFYKEQSPIR